jgi:hypothetical protein
MSSDSPNGNGINGRDTFTGLGGWFRQWSSLGIVGTLCGLTILLVIWSRMDAGRAWSEHRQDIHDFYNTHRSDLDKRDAAALEAHKSAGKISDAVGRQDQTLRDLSRAIQGLGNEVKKLREERQARAGELELLPGPP